MHNPGGFFEKRPGRVLGGQRSQCLDLVNDLLLDRRQGTGRGAFQGCSLRTEASETPMTIRGKLAPWVSMGLFCFAIYESIASGRGQMPLPGTDRTGIFGRRALDQGTRQGRA